MSWRNMVMREQLDIAAMLSLARERFPPRSVEIAARVMMIFHANFRIGSRLLHANARLLEDLGFDGMDIPQMIEAVKNEFTVQFHDGDLERGMTLDGLIAKVEKASVQQKRPNTHSPSAPGVGGR